MGGGGGRVAWSLQFRPPPSRRTPDLKRIFPRALTHSFMSGPAAYRPLLFSKPNLSHRAGHLLARRSRRGIDAAGSYLWHYSLRCPVLCDRVGFPRRPIPPLSARWPLSLPKAPLQKCLLSTCFGHSCDWECSISRPPIRVYWQLWPGGRANPLFLSTFVWPSKHVCSVQRNKGA